ncbi:hypothetical protein V8G54_008047 [Vigna mungo]|uniref:Chromo domain-containing protein n=1 Tax=Vigna mungo TaxID=3915 RepID=A0AAQ3P4G0_VIGMU
MAIQKWKHYLLGRHFIVHTDQNSLKFLVNQRLMSEEQYKWIVYKEGIENRATDALSRKLQYSAISTVQFFEWEELKAEIEKDVKLKKILQDLLVKEGKHPRYKLSNGRLYYQEKLHSGYFRTYKRIASLFFWEGTRKNIQEGMRKNIQEYMMTAGGKDTTLVVVDRLTKYTHFIALAHPYNAKDVADLFLKEVMTPFKALYGRDLPLVIRDVSTTPMNEVAVMIQDRNEVLVKWKNMSNCENSWESLSNMMEAFPELHLEDKEEVESHLMETTNDFPDNRIVWQGEGM